MVIVTHFPIPYSQILMATPITQEIMYLAKATESRYEVIDKIIDDIPADDGYSFKFKKIVYPTNDILLGIPLKISTPVFLSSSPPF